MTTGFPIGRKEAIGWVHEGFPEVGQGELRFGLNSLSPMDIDQVLELGDFLIDALFQKTVPLLLVGIIRGSCRRCSSL